MAAQLAPLEQLQFDNRFVHELPVDATMPTPPDIGASVQRRQISNACYSWVQPTPTAQPELIAYAAEVAELLDLSPADCATPEFLAVFSGNRVLAGMQPHASCYGGHQFGNWAGQLGDGRAINLGEVLNKRGERWVLQLKGAGPTPYSRTADGLAVLRSSVREFLCSEAMHHLGVPTTRALSLCLTGEQVMRDMLYDGNPAYEPGAVVCRVAPSFTRFGHYQMIAARGEFDLLRQFLNYNIATDFPELQSLKDDKEAALGLFETVCQRTLAMVVHWMRVGFVHGVMNTDNMSIMGLTIDYGPYGWLENYDPNWTPNTTDNGNKRYRFGYQAAVAQWNLLQLANALYPIVDEAAPLEALLNAFEADYQSAWQQMMMDKLGLKNFTAADNELMTELDRVLGLTEIDMTLFYRALADLDVTAGDEDPSAHFADALYVPDQVTAETQSALNGWLGDYAARVRLDNRDKTDRAQGMNATNPIYVLRNYLAQLAIDDAERGDFARIHELLAVLRNPYDVQEGKQQYADKRPDWARTRVGCSMLSCSS